MKMCMTEEHSEKFTNELGNLNTNLALLNQKFDAALELANKDVALRFAEHERDCPARNQKRDSSSQDAEKRRASAFMAAWGPQILKWLPWVLLTLSGGKIGMDIVNNQQPAAVTASEKSGE